MKTPTISIFCAPIPPFKLACGRLPDTRRDLCSQRTLSRPENTPRLRDVIRLTYAPVDQQLASYEKPPSSVTLDIDDTGDVAQANRVLDKNQTDSSD